MTKQITKKVLDQLSVTVAHNTVISIKRIEQKEITIIYNKAVNDAMLLAEFLNNAMSPVFWREFKQSINNQDVDSQIPEDIATDGSIAK